MIGIRLLGSVSLVHLLLAVALFVWLGKHGFFDPSEEAGDGPDSD